MNPLPLNDDEFYELLGQLVDGELSSKQVTRLESELSASVERRTAYRDWMRIHAGLAWPRRWQSDELLSSLTTASGSAETNLEAASKSLPVNHIFRSRSNTGWILAGVAVAAVGLALLVVNPLRDNRVDDSVAFNVDEMTRKLPCEIIEEQTIAVISEAVGVTWSDDSQWQSGQSLIPGKLKFETGLVQLDFDSGARLVCRGPAELELISTMSVRMHTGAATCYVGELGKGFKILTGQSEVIDLGTSFGIRIQPDGNSEVHVFEGAVSVRKDANSETVEFTKNSAVRVSPEEIAHTTYSEDGFPRFEEVMTQRDEQSRLRHAAWKLQAQQISEDPDVMVHYRFDDSESGGIELVNHSTNPERGTNGAILRARWCEGRWPEKRGLQFTEMTDRVLLKIPGSYDEFTFVMWVRPDAFLHETTALMLSEHPRRWKMHGTLSNEELNHTKAPSNVFRWVVNQAGYARIGLNYLNDGNPSRQFATYGRRNFGPEGPESGRWVCYALTVDPRLQQVSNYYNGQLVRVTKLREPVALPFDTLEIGNVSTTAKHERGNEPYPFFGVIDEVIIAKRAMASSEIAEIYDVGRRTAEQ